MCPAPADKKAKMEKVGDDFSLEAGLSASTAKVQQAHTSTSCILAGRTSAHVDKLRPAVDAHT